MQKIFSLVILGLMIISILGVVSAVVSVPVSGTDVSGTIYDANDYTPIDGATVTVSCLHNDVTNTGDTTSNEDGYYTVLFDKSKCALDDALTVTATKGSLSGSNTGTVTSVVVRWNI